MVEGEPMEAINRNRFFIREHAGLLRAARNLDILDAESGELLLECREQNLGRLSRFLRYSNYRGMTPFDICVQAPAGQPLVRIVRGIPVLKSRVHVYDDEDELIGGFAQKLFSVSGAFDVWDAQGIDVCQLRGGLTGWNFRFLSLDGVELARVTKKWAGIVKELCTSADDYLLEIDETVPADSTIRRLILASGLCIDLVLKVEVP